MKFRRVDALPLRGVLLSRETETLLVEPRGKEPTGELTVKSSAGVMILELLGASKLLSILKESVLGKVGQ